MPTVQPRELWDESGRWKFYGKELLRLKDRKDADFCLGPTHEEVVTDIVRKIITSYKQLPINLFQIQTKFRDEIRPRFGLMRGREFIMKDGLLVSRGRCRRGSRVLEDVRGLQAHLLGRLGVKFRPVEADSGAIGGSFTHEFHVLASSGEDAILSCSACEYTSNVEKTEAPQLAVPIRLRVGGRTAARALPYARHRGDGRAGAGVSRRGAQWPAARPRVEVLCVPCLEGRVEVGRRRRLAQRPRTECCQVEEPVGRRCGRTRAGR